MSQSLSKVYVHITFSTKNREALIDKNVETALFEYLGGICKGMECYPLKVGGHKDHVHIACTLSRKVAQMALLEELKKQSSKWIKTKGEAYNKFYWSRPRRELWYMFSKSNRNKKSNRLYNKSG
jgi:putative transposase